MIRNFKHTIRCVTIILLCAFYFQDISFSQTFMKVTDPSNPVATTNFDNNYSGAAWIDFNNDGNLDLYSTENFLFSGDGNGNFMKITTDLGMGLGGQSVGPTWGDYDNDGDIDCYLAASPSILFRNDGNNTFTPYIKGDFGPEADTRGWAGSWADVNNDGYIDLFVTHPAGYVGSGPTPNHFYINNGDGTFTENFDNEFSMLLDTYTIATWYDYDMDGDVDLFIGCGPVGTPAVDKLYKNMFIETGTATFERIENSVIATDLQDGQVWNLIDYDNDGDLDAYITNYSGAPDRFYRNDDGEYVFVDNELNNTGLHLGNAWADFDNDGDLDVVVTSDQGAGNTYFRNDDGTFIKDSTAFTISGNTRASAIGDYNNDGKLDVFFSGTGNAVGLYLNTTENNNNWVKLDLIGTVSNRSALGAKVKIKAAINGNSVWQFREVNAQNGFNSQNSLRVHFGLGDASSIDSVIVIWPSGNEDVLTNQSVNKLYTITEPIPSGFLRADFIADKPEGFGTGYTAHFSDISVVDPGTPITSWEWDFDNDGTVDATEQNPEWTYGSLGTYTVKLIVKTSSVSDTKTKTGYITIKRLPGYPIITFEDPSFSDTTVTVGTRKIFTVAADDTSGYKISYQWYLDGVKKDIDENYNYTALGFIPSPAPRIDTITVEISNGYNSTFRTWYVQVEKITEVDQDNNIYPDQFSLEQNYPNPFNPSTKIKYSIPEETHVVLKIYNIVGQQVSVLVNEKKIAGFYESSFEGKNLPSGIYICQITAGSFTSSRKMILIK